MNPSTTLLSARRRAAVPPPLVTSTHDAHADFLAEAKLTLKQIHEDSLALSDGGGLARLGVLFRNVHSYKSLMAFAGMETPSRFAAELEQYLSRLFHGHLPFDRQATDLVRKGVASLSCLDPTAAPTMTAPNSATVLSDLRAALGEASRAQEEAALAVGAASAPATPAANERTTPVGCRQLGEIEGLTGNAIRLIGRLQAMVHEIEDERLQTMVVAVQRSLEQLRQSVHQHRFASLRGFFLPFTATVQEMAASQGKLANMRLRVADVEADKATLQALGVPMVHVLRNAISHGLETPEERTKAGKPVEGTLTITADVRDNCLFVAIEDDGHGFDPQALREAGVRVGALSPERAALTSDNDARLLAFVPGLSTSSGQDGLSGHGMGLAAVEEALASLGGQVSLDSRPGAGTTITLQVPIG